MPNKIYILDSKKIHETVNSIRLIKRYHITLLNIFPKVLDTLIREYIDDIIEVTVGIYNTTSERYRIIVAKSYINYIPISFSFFIDIDPFKERTIESIICSSISDNIINTLCNYFTQHKYVWMHITNVYMTKMYNHSNYFNCISANEIIMPNKNICEYNEIITIEIKNHKLFKNIIVIMIILCNYFQKKNI